MLTRGCQATGESFSFPLEYFNKDAQIFQFIYALNGTTRYIPVEQCLIIGPSVPG
jgi:hypothetical protein